MVVTMTTCLSFLLLLVCSLARGETGEDGAGVEAVTPKQGEATFICPGNEEDEGSSAPVEQKIIWEKKVNGSENFEVIEKDEKFEISEDELELKVKSVVPEDLGEYRCLTNGQPERLFELTKKNFRMKKMKKSYSVDVGDDTKESVLNCSIIPTKGNEKVEVEFEWYVRGEDEALPAGGAPGERICNEPNGKCKMDRMSLKPAEDKKSVVLSITNATLDDRKIYSCIVKQKDKDSIMNPDWTCEADPFCGETETLLRVKDPLAAIWPFIGIVAEVVILCIVIFFCERRREGKEEELDEDEGYNGNNANTSNSNVRQRK